MARLLKVQNGEKNATLKLILEYTPRIRIQGQAIFLSVTTKTDLCSEDNRDLGARGNRIIFSVLLDTVGELLQRWRREGR
jgi:hypothetical protein